MYPFTLEGALAHVTFVNWVFTNKWQSWHNSVYVAVCLCEDGGCAERCYWWVSSQEVGSQPVFVLLSHYLIVALSTSSANVLLCIVPQKFFTLKNIHFLMSDDPLVFQSPSETLSRVCPLSFPSLSNSVCCIVYSCQHGAFRTCCVDMCVRCLCNLLNQISSYVWVFFLPSNFHTLKKKGGTQNKVLDHQKSVG